MEGQDYNVVPKVEVCNANKLSSSDSVRAEIAFNDNSVCICEGFFNNERRDSKAKYSKVHDDGFQNSGERLQGSYLFLLWVQHTE